MSETMKYRLSGQKEFYVPVIEKVMSSKDDNVVTATTPEWMIKIVSQAGNATESSILGYEEYCELLGWLGESSIKINKTSAEFPAASLVHSEVIIVIPTGGYVAILENQLNNVVALPKVEIINFAQGQKLQTVNYTDCTLMSVQQELERTVVKMSIKTRENVINVYKAGMPTGQKVSFVNYVSGKTEK